MTKQTFLMIRRRRRTIGQVGAWLFLTAMVVAHNVLTTSATETILLTRSSVPQTVDSRAIYGQDDAESAVVDASGGAPEAAQRDQAVASPDTSRKVLTMSATPHAVDATMIHGHAVKDEPAKNELSSGGDSSVGDRRVLTWSRTPQPVDAQMIHGNGDDNEDDLETVSQAEKKPSRIVYARRSPVQPVDMKATFAQEVVNKKSTTTTTTIIADPVSSEPERLVLTRSTTAQPVDVPAIHVDDADKRQESSSHLPETQGATSEVTKSDGTASNTRQAPQAGRLVLTMSPTPQKVDQAEAIYGQQQEQVVTMDGSLASAAQNSSTATLQAASRRRTTSSTSNTIALTAEPRLVVESAYVLQLSKHPRSLQTASRDLRNQAAAAETVMTTRSILQFSKYVSAVPSQAARFIGSGSDDVNATETASDKRLPRATAQDFASRILGFSDTPPGDNNQAVGAALGSASRSERIVLTRSDPQPGDERANVYRLLARRAEAQRAQQFHSSSSPDSVHSSTPVTNMSTSSSSPDEATSVSAQTSDTHKRDLVAQASVTDKVGQEDFASMPITILSQDDASVTFELTQQWMDALNWMAIEYYTDFGWNCPSFQRVPQGKSQLFTAKCSPEGTAEVSVFCRHFSFQGDARVPGYCNAPHGNKIATYFSLPCKKTV